MDDNKTQGGGVKRRPLRFCRRPFVKDFLRFLLGLSPENKLAHNKRPEGSSRQLDLFGRPLGKFTEPANLDENRAGMGFGSEAET